MNKKITIPAAVFFILSPAILGGVLASTEPPTSVYGVVVVLASVLGIPFIAVTGLIVSLIFRKSPDATIYTLLGYGLPAIVPCGWEVAQYLA